MGFGWITTKCAKDTKVVKVCEWIRGNGVIFSGIWLTG